MRSNAFLRSVSAQLLSNARVITQSFLQTAHVNEPIICDALSPRCPSDDKRTMRHV